MNQRVLSRNITAAGEDPSVTYKVYSTDSSTFLLWIGFW